MNSARTQLNIFFLYSNLNGLVTSITASCSNDYSIFFVCFKATQRKTQKSLRKVDPFRFQYGATHGWAIHSHPSIRIQNLWKLPRYPANQAPPPLAWLPSCNFNLSRLLPTISELLVQIDVNVASHSSRIIFNSISIQVLTYETIRIEQNNVDNRRPNSGTTSQQECYVGRLSTTTMGRLSQCARFPGEIPQGTVYSKRL